MKSATPSPPRSVLFAPPAYGALSPPGSFPHRSLSVSLASFLTSPAFKTCFYILPRPFSLRSHSPAQKKTPITAEDSQAAFLLSESLFTAKLSISLPQGFILRSEIFLSSLSAAPFPSFRSASEQYPPGIRPLSAYKTDLRSPG